MPDLPPQDLIPQDGLCEVLRGWSGRGLLSTVAGLALGNQVFDREWHASDIVARARRTLLSRLAEEKNGAAGPISRLPAHVDEWLDVVPAAALRHRRTDAAPFRGVDWVATRRLHGWPPTAFSGRVRHRVADDSLLAPAAWVLDRLVSLAELQATLPQEVSRRIALPIRAATELLEHETIRQLMPGQRPNGENLAMLSSEGAPWSTIAEIGRVLAAVEDDPHVMARLVIFPDEAIAWRLFHLACLGEILLAFGQHGYRVVSLRPVGGDGARPVYKATIGGISLDIWFEGAGAWAYYGVSSPYRNAAPADGRPLGADILVRAQDGSKVFLVECKYYLNNPQQIPRDGYVQALAYAAEAHGRLAPQVCSVAVGPDRLLPWRGQVSTAVGEVHICSHVHLRSLVTAFFNAKP